MTSKRTQLLASDAKRLKNFASKLAQAKAEKALLDAQLRDLDKRIWEMEFNQLPELMHELGIEETVFEDGLMVKLHMFYKASLPKAGALRQRAFAWLRQNGFGEIIKHEIAVNFSSGHDKQAIGLTKYLEKTGLQWSDSETIHHATLTAFIKEQFESGNGKLPLDALGAFIGERVVVKS